MGHRFSLQLVAKPPTDSDEEMAKCPHSIFKGVCTRCGMDEYAIRGAKIRASMKELQANMAKVLSVQGTITMTVQRDVASGELVFRSEVKPKP